MTLTQALLLALLQGISELFPISSLGHTILVPAVLQWKNVDRSAPSFLAFVVVLHLGTAIALILFYRAKWWAIARSMTRSVIRGSLSDDRDERTGWLLVLGTIPVGILGVVLEHPVRTLFGSPVAASAFLAINGLTMFVGERLRRRAHLADTRPIERLSYGQSLLIGLAQSLALLPGISRSGISMVAGPLCAASTTKTLQEFSFLLATPVILAAALFEIPRLLAPAAHLALVEALLGAIVAGVAAYFSVAFLTRYFKSNDLRPFGWYCVVFGIIALVLSLRGIIT